MPYKALTHDYRPPIQGGDPIWDGTPGAVLPKVETDCTYTACSAGWNYCDTVAQCLTIAGLWPDGWPSAVVEVEPIGSTFRCENKSRAPSLRIHRQLSESEIRPAVEEMSVPFGSYQQGMCDAQMAWRTALSRPLHDRGQVEAGLAQALKVRGLKWTLQDLRVARDAENAKDVENARAAWAARAARDAWDAWAVVAAWNARNVTAVRAILDARAAWTTWPIWDAWDKWANRDWADIWNTWDAWDTRAAWAARAAMTVQYAALQGWILLDPLHLTTGLQDAYRNGLDRVSPTGKDTLSYTLHRETDT